MRNGSKKKKNITLKKKISALYRFLKLSPKLPCRRDIKIEKVLKLNFKIFIFFENSEEKFFLIDLRVYIRVIFFEICEMRTKLPWWRCLFLTFILKTANRKPGYMGTFAKTETLTERVQACDN